MAYTRQYTTDVGWQNAPSVATPINATNLNKMDDAIGNIDAAVYNEFIEAERIATTSAVGRVKPDGTTITVDNDGTIHGADSTPIATTSVAGKVKPDGSTITVDANGTITAAASAVMDNGWEVTSSMVSSAYGTINLGQYFSVDDSVIVCLAIKTSATYQGSGNGWVIKYGGTPAHTADMYKKIGVGLTAFADDLENGSTLITQYDETNQRFYVIAIIASGGMPENPLGISHGGTGNTVGYIQTGLASGVTAGSAATSEGYETQATGNYSHAEGYQTQAGSYAHAEGYQTVASGNYSHASGAHTIAGSNGQFVIGKYNNNVSTNIFEIGYGSDENSRKNVFAVSNGGNVTVEGSIDVGGAIDANGNIYGADLSVTGSISAGGTITDGNGNSIPSLPLSTSNGGTGNSRGYIITGKKENTTVGDAATIEGVNNTGSGMRCHVEGAGCTASGNMSHAEGNSSKAIGNYSHAEGGGEAGGNYSHAEGYSTLSTGDFSHAEGNSAFSVGNYSHAGGQSISTSGTHTFAHGQGLAAGYNHQAIVGKYNSNKSTTLFEVGNGTSSSAKSNAFEVYSDGKISQDNGTTKFKFGNNGTSDGYYDASGTFHAFGGGGGSSTLSGLTDTSISSPTNGQVLKYNSTSNKWENGTDADTHRPIKVNGSQVLGDNTTALDLVAGTNVTLSESGGAVTISASGGGSGSTMSKTKYTISYGSWSSSANSSGYYTYTVTLNPTLNTDFCPNVSLAGSGTSYPTDTHRSMYRMIRYFSHTASSSLTLYASAKPTSTFYIWIEGVNS